MGSRRKELSKRTYVLDGIEEIPPAWREPE